MENLARPYDHSSKEEIQALLLEKIAEEKAAFRGSEQKLDFNNIGFTNSRFNILSLFSGCGGLDLGFEMAAIKAAGFDVEQAFLDKDFFLEKRELAKFKTIFSNDIFKEASQTYRQNIGEGVFIDHTDIRKILDFPRADIVLGGFPCPGFSSAGPRLLDDKRNFLYLHFIRCLMQSQPSIFVAENVKGMMTLGGGEAFKQIVEDFSAAGYQIYHKLLNAQNYGVPQSRERVILVGVRKDIDFEYVFPQAKYGKEKDQKPIVSLQQAIGDLQDCPGEYFKGTYSSMFLSRNRKKSWDQPSFTIQASGRQAPIHPAGAAMQKIDKDKYVFADGEDNRRLSISEIARIQTFPDWYKFSKGQSNRNENSKVELVYKQIGNAVPVRLAMEIALPIAYWVKQQDDLQAIR